MRVVQIKTTDDKTRYLLADDNWDVVVPVMQFLRYKDGVGKSRNTLRSYCYSLKYFFEFLQQKDLVYLDVTIDDMADFVRWVKSPKKNIKVLSLQPYKMIRNTTVNLHIAQVTAFYDYLMRHKDYEIQLSNALKTHILGSQRGYKDFLYHINKDRLFEKNALKQTTPRKKPQSLEKENVEKLVACCSNFRDCFLLCLLWESGIRIGEALALYIEDIDIGECIIHIKDRGELQNLAEIKTPCSPRSLEVSRELIDMYLQYLALYHSNDVDTNHVFVLQSGKNKYQPMDYDAVNALFRRLSKKTGIHVTPHMFRHSSLTALMFNGWDITLLKERAGHKSVSSTSIYMHVNQKQLVKSWRQVEDNIKLKQYHMEE